MYVVISKKNIIFISLKNILPGHIEFTRMKLTIYLNRLKSCTVYFFMSFSCTLKCGQACLYANTDEHCEVSGSPANDLTADTSVER